MAFFHRRAHPCHKEGAAGGKPQFEGMQAQPGLFAPSLAAALAGKHLSEYSKMRDSAYNRAIHGFLSECKENGIPLHDAWQEKEKFTQPIKQQNSADISSNQLPNFIGLTNNPHALLFSIFPSKTKNVHDRTLEGGMFGHSAKVTCGGDTCFPKDAVTIIYMLNHMKHERKLGELAPFIPVECTVGSKGGNEEAIALAEKRHSNLIRALEKQGYVVMKTGKTPCLLFTGADGKKERFFLPILVHNIAECEYYVKENGSIIPFEKWAGGNGIGNCRHMQELFASLDSHRGERGYFEELVSLLQEAVHVCKCVDSRTGSTGSEKDLAAIKSPDEKAHYLRTHSPPIYEDDLHTGCGALKAGMAFHNANTELREMFEHAVENGFSDEAEYLYLEKYKQQMGKLFEKERKRPILDLSVFISEMEEKSGARMSRGTIDFLKEVFSKDTNDMQHTIRSLKIKGVLRWVGPSNQYAMRSADWVRRQAEKGNNPPIATEKFTSALDQVILFESYLQWLGWKKAIAEAGSGTRALVGVESLEDNSKVKVVKGEGNRLMVVDFYTGEPV